MGDSLDLGWVVATDLEDLQEALQVSDRVVVRRSPLASEPTIQISTERHMIGIACQLTDVVDVIHDGCHGTLRGRGEAGWIIEIPRWIQHGFSEHDADDTIPVEDRLDHFVRQVTLARDQGAAIAVAGVDWTIPGIQQLPECDISRMGDIQCDAGSLQGFK